MQGTILYQCDPEKNVKCRKTGCYLNAHSIPGMKCQMTKYPEFAKTNEKGEKIIRLVKEETGNGDTEIYKIFDMGND